MQSLCPKPSSNHCSSPSVGCREGEGGISWAAVLGDTSLRALNFLCLLLLFCLTPPLLPSLQSLTSLFYGEQSEKEKSPSESSPLDADNKDVVSGSGCGSGSGNLGWASPGPACPVLHQKPRSEVKYEKLNLLLNSLKHWGIPGSWRVFCPELFEASVLDGSLEWVLLLASVSQLHGCPCSCGDLVSCMARSWLHACKDLSYPSG